MARTKHTARKQKVGQRLSEAEALEMVNKYKTFLELHGHHPGSSKLAADEEERSLVSWFRAQKRAFSSKQVIYPTVLDRLVSFLGKNWHKVKVTRRVE